MFRQGQCAFLCSGASVARFLIPPFDSRNAAHPCADRGAPSGDRGHRSERKSLVAAHPIRTSSVYSSGVADHRSVANRPRHALRLNVMRHRTPAVKRAPRRGKRATFNCGVGKTNLRSLPENGSDTKPPHSHHNTECLNVGLMHGLLLPAELGVGSGSPGFHRPSLLWMLGISASMTASGLPSL